MPSAWKADRIRSATTTIFAEMSALALATQSVNLGQGFPDTDGPAFMLEEARGAIAGGMNQYQIPVAQISEANKPGPRPPYQALRTTAASGS